MTRGFVVWPNGQIDEAEFGSIEDIQKLLYADTVEILPCPRRIKSFSLQGLNDVVAEAVDPMFWCDEDGLPKMLLANPLVAYALDQWIVGPVFVMSSKDMPQ